jgi:hypothetical protein
MHPNAIVSPKTFNHGVEGSSPSALTNNIRHNLNSEASGRKPCVCTLSANDLPKRLRRAVALPIYAIALILALLTNLLDSLAGKIAGDEE